MAKYDVENLLTDIQAYMVANFQAKLTEINNEKADGITLSAPDNNAYFLQTINDKIANYDPFVIYGIDRATTDSLGLMSVRKWIVSVIIVLADTLEADSANTQIISHKILRYSRALTELFEENSDRVASEV